MNIDQLKECSARFFAEGEPYAGGFYEFPERDRFYRFARAQRRYWEAVPIAAYDGGDLYPCGPVCAASYRMFPNYSYTFGVHWERLEEQRRKNPQEDGWEERLLREENDLLTLAPPPHTVGGNLYTHSLPNYGRIEAEGLGSYRLRVEALPPGDFRDGLLEVLDGIQIYHRRVLEKLREAKGPDRLILALEKVPFAPAESLYEALVCRNFIFYIDGCDNPGRLDAELFRFYRGEDVTGLLREFFRHVDENNGWSSALGPDYNPLTIQCLRAIQGMRRPSLELRVTRDMPKEVWQAAIEAVATGCGQPAFYNEEAYQEMLSETFPEIPKEDLLRFNGGGCTETMLAGVSNVGSLDAGIHLPYIFTGYLESHLEDSPDFDSFYQGLLQEIRLTIRQVLEQVNALRRRRAQVRPQPVRTLLIDDCIDRGVDYNDGGARYAWSVINLAGMVNVIDSLLTVRELVYQTREYTSQAFLRLLREQEPRFLLRARRSACYGVDDPLADRLAADFFDKVMDAFEGIPCWPSGKFLPSSIQFATYASAGEEIPATPDGRSAGSPLADSLAPVHGKDIAGATAMLSSVASLPLNRMVGTPVVNLRVQKQFLSCQLEGLVKGFFRKGGMQLQVSCYSREELLDALEHPQRHQNLIVRVGGYSEYFNRLSPQLQQAVLERTEHWQ